MSSVLTPADVFPPGDYLRDELEERGWTSSEFAEIIGRPVQVVSEILNGKKEITPETAVAIADALGTSAELWLNLESAHRLHHVRAGRAQATPIARRARLRQLVPVRELQRRGWLPETADIEVLEGAVCELLDTSSPAEEPHIGMALAARRSNASDDVSSQQIVWVKRIQKLGNRAELPPFDADALRALAEGLARRIKSPVDLGELKAWLAECGVALVIELPLKGSKIDGVVLFSPKGRPIIGLSTRWNRMDSFVFTLLHEIAHLLLGHVTTQEDVRLDEDLNQSAGSGIEGEANEQAGEWIFPGGFTFPSGRPTMPTIVEVAEKHGVHGSLVIGRLQKDKDLDWPDFRRHIPRVRPFVDLG